MMDSGPLSVEISGIFTMPWSYAGSWGFSQPVCFTIFCGLVFSKLFLFLRCIPGVLSCSYL